MASVPECLLQTARLSLRPPTGSDAAALAALMTPAISRWMARWSVPFTTEMARARIRESLAATASGQALACVIEHEGSLAGWIAGTRLSQPGSATFGFWLGEPHHGKALMQEAAPAFVAALQAHLALQSVEAACQPGNVASARVLSRCGLRRMGRRWDHAPARNRDELVDVWERTWSTAPARQA